MVEERQLKIGSACEWMSRSREGLVVAVRGLQEIWVLEEPSLRLVRRIPLVGLMRVESAPTIATAVAVCGAASTNDKGTRLAVVDLAAGKVEDVFTVRDLRWRLHAPRVEHAEAGKLEGFCRTVITPDGRFVLCLSNNTLHRFRLNGLDLAYEEIGPHIKSAQVWRLEVTADSQYVGFPVMCLNDPGPVSNPRHDNGCLVFEVGDLQKSAVSFSVGPHPKCFGFDPTGRRFYSDADLSKLMAFSEDGSELAEYAILRSGSRVKQILFGGSRGCAAILTNKELLWVELGD